MRLAFNIDEALPGLEAEQDGERYIIVQFNTGFEVTYRGKKKPDGWIWKGSSIYEALEFCNGHFDGRQ